MIFIKPAPGMRVRNPDQNYQLLPPEGEYVPRSPYWAKKIRDRVVLVVAGPAAASTPSEE